MNQKTTKAKRILVISNACFQNGDSNGRTLEKLFETYDKSCLAQFFVYGNPDFLACERYYQVSDQAALRSLLTWRETGRVVRDVERIQMSDMRLTSSRKKKSSLKMLLREIIWKFGRWNGGKLRIWIEQFQPEAIFLSVADNVFLIRFAKQLSTKYQIPIYLFSTENYYFKQYNYITKSKSLWYQLFHSWLKKAYRSVQSHVRYGLLNTPMLRDCYTEEFSYPCRCVFSPSSIDFQENWHNCDTPVVSYLGNLGLSRHLALIQLADILGEIVPGARLHVYGRVPNDEVRSALCNSEHIDYCGVVSYHEVVKVIHQSTLVTHAEWNDKFLNEDLKTGFSTKIADSVCSGTPFLAFAHKGLAGIDFLIRNQCAFVAETEEELREQLRLALFDEDARRKVVENAKITREKYFRNTDDIVRIINEEM